MHHTKDPVRQLRSIRTCWRPAADSAPKAPPRSSGRYVPELAAALDEDRRLCDGAKLLGRHIAAYTHARDRDSHTAEITVTWLMKATRKSRRTVQRHLRQLERAGYIETFVIHARTRMCAGLLIRLLAPLLPRHGWRQKAMKPDAPRLSQKHRFRYKTRLIPLVLWTLRCTQPIERAWDAVMTPLTPINWAA